MAEILKLFMNNFLSKSFSLIFLVLFLVSVFLMEGEYNFYLFFFWSLFISFYTLRSLLKEKQKKTIKSRKNLSNTKKNQLFFDIKIKVFFICFLFLLAALISILFSHHLPLSLEKYLFYLLAFSIFLFFLKIKNDVFKIKLFIELLLLLTIILNILVILLSFFGGFSYLFQGMNLLVRSYGHNHYAAFLLLILPLVWWRLLKKVSNYFVNRKVGLFINVFLIISSYLILIISLARWALLIAILQLLVFFVFAKKDFYNLRKRLIISFLLKLSIFIFLFLSTLFLFLSLPIFTSHSINNCPLSFYKKDLCLSVSQNSRQFYWRQAWLTVKKYPIFGYGLGTFKNAARLFPVVNEKHSSYAHNIFLHNLAEMGVVGGGLFIYLIFFVFYRSYKQMRKSKRQLDKFLFVAALSSLINAMIDFDWHFFVIFVLTLIFLALILKGDEKIISKQRLNKLWVFYSLILTLFFTLLMILELLVVRRIFVKFNFFTKLSPIFNLAVKAPLDEKVFSLSDYEFFYKFYRYDVDFIYKFLRKENLGEEQKIELYLDLAQLDPAGFVRTVDFQELSEFGLDKVELLTREWLKIVEEQEMLDGRYFFISYDRKISLSEEMFSFAERAYEQDDWSRASYFYQLAHYLNPYIFSELRPAFLDETNPDNLILFLKEFKDFPAREVIDLYGYFFLYRQATSKLFQAGRLNEFEQMLTPILEQEPEFAAYLIGPLYETTKDWDKIKFLSEIEEQYIY